MKNAILTAFTLGAATIASQAASIGINLGSGRANASLASTDAAGVISQTNWNNGAGGSGSIGSLINDLGAPSGASVTWASDEQWGHGGAPADNNGRLLTGWISENNNGTDSTINITGIPYAEYDLYIYISHDRDMEDVILSEGSLAFPAFTAAFDNTDTTLPVVFNQQAVSEEGGGNYVRFSGVTSANLNLIMSPVDLGPGSLDRNAVAAIQIVQVPEPSAGILAMLAAFCLCTRRRR